jgi:hypothetical protein
LYVIADNLASRIFKRKKSLDPNVTSFLIIRRSFNIKGILEEEKSIAYTVTKLAKISGVSVRTLHWYDKVGLLKPAYHGLNGYRYYEEEQLLSLRNRQKSHIQANLAIV